MPKKNGASGTAMVKWEERLAQMAGEATATQSDIGGGGNFVSIQGGQLSFQGASVQGNVMRVVILDAILENQWYDQPFDSANPTSPACYAFGRDARAMVPHAAAAAPQHSDCASCPKMQFGSADRGKGKACKACERLALITEQDVEGGEIEGAEIAFMKLPFYSTLEYAAYTRQLADLYKRHVLAFITELSVVPDPKSQFRVKFKMVAKIEEPEVVEALIKAAEKAQATIDFPYPEAAPAPPAPPARAPRAAKPDARAATPAAPRRVVAAPVTPSRRAVAAAPVAPAAAAAGVPVVGRRKAVATPRY